MLSKPRLAALALMASFAASAQSLKPGLWEITHKTGGNAEMDQAMVRMQKQMAAMPPEQRKQMEAMMAQHGASLPTAAAGGGIAMKVCISPEMAARNELPQQTEGDCTTNVSSRSSGMMKMSFVCSNPPSRGDGTYTFSSDKAYTAAMTITSERKGKPETLTINGSGKWLDADCGTVKPLAAPKAQSKVPGK